MTSPSTSSDRCAIEGDILKLFAHHMLQRRTALGMSQEDLAHAAGLDRTYISGIERARRNLGLKNVHRIAQALQLKPHELLSPLP